MIGLLGTCGYVAFLREPRLPNGPYEVRLRPDATYQQTTEVFLVDITSHVEKKLFTLSDIYRDHYHPAEFVHGSIYIIRRFGDPATTGTDELWKYDITGKGKRIYVEPGMDFRVSGEAQRIAIFASMPDQKIVITDLEGEDRKEFSRKDIPALSEGHVLAPLMWHERLLWFGAFEGLSLTRLFSLDVTSDSIVAYDVSHLGVTRGEFAFEPVSRLLVYSDYHPRLDTEDPARQTAILLVYGLSNQKKISLIKHTSTMQAFEPKWIDGATVEYTDPVSNSRVQIRIPSF